MGRLARWMTVPAVAAAGRALRRRRGIDWHGRVVLVVGASRGLGLAIARELVDQGAKVVIAARDAGRLEARAGELRAAGGQVRAVSADIGDPEQARRLVDEALAWQGRLDALFNVAGVLTVAPVATLDIDDFREAIDVMALGPVACTLAALPALGRSDAGRVANITSIGGKLPVPHLLPYAVAKHAAVGFSESLRAELGSRGVRVTTVVPGFMRTGSHIHALVKGSHRREYRWFAALSEMPLLAMRADRAARKIVEATARGDAVASTTWWAPLAARAHGLTPGMGSRAAGLISPVLPDPGAPAAQGGGDQAKRRMPGHETGASLGPLSKRAEQAIAAYGQRPHGESK